MSSIMAMLLNALARTDRDSLKLNRVKNKYSVMKEDCTLLFAKGICLPILSELL